jgi:TonB family protein
MALRCLLFSSDEGTAEPILQVLAGLEVEGELCSQAVTAVEKVSQQSFQIVIIDWDMQPEAALLLTSARERKAAERPLTLAIVSDDLSVPKALQAGANSILRKPLLVNQVKDTLTTARDLLRAKQESAANNALAAAAGASAGASAQTAPPVSISTLPSNLEPGKERNLRAGEFLQSAPSAPGGQFVTDSDVPDFRVSSSVEKDLEPVAASVEEKANPAPPPEVGEVRGLEWYLKTRAGIMPQASVSAAAHPPAHASAPPASEKPELLGFDQTASFSPAATIKSTTTMSAANPPAPTRSDDSAGTAAPEASLNPPAREAEKRDQSHEQKKEAELFAYITSGSGESEDVPRPRFRLRGAIIGALALASVAIVAAPQAPWHSSVQTAWARGRLTLHAWLNPQPVTTPQAPIAHEDFGRAGDEYMLPVTQNIPDATTDPSQIQVVPVVDPTVKPKPNIMGGNTMPAGTTEAAAATPGDPTPAPGVSTAGNQVPQPTVTAQPASGPGASGTSTSPTSASPAANSPNSALPASTLAGPTPPSSTSPIPTVPASTPPSGPVPAAPRPAHSDPPATVFPSASSASSVPTQPSPKTQPPQSVSTPGNVPSSLKSQMTSATPEASGNRSDESAMPSIEPVVVPEAAERALLTDQPAPDYPANSSGQPGMVVLQVLIDRDGAVQDAKFLQGSLAFARAAIDGVKHWKFKPYSMNGRPVSVQTSLTISFKPAS